MLPLFSVVLHRNFKTIQFSDKLKTLRKGSFKTFNKATEGTYELLTIGGKKFHRHRNHLIPYCPKLSLLFHQIVLYDAQHPVTTHDSGTSNMIQSDLNTSYDNSEFDDHILEHGPRCKGYDDRSTMFDIDFYKSVNLDDDDHHPSHSQKDFENFVTE